MTAGRPLIAIVLVAALLVSLAVPARADGAALETAALVSLAVVAVIVVVYLVVANMRGGSTADSGPWIACADAILTTCGAPVPLALALDTSSFTAEPVQSP